MSSNLNNFISNFQNSLVLGKEIIRLNNFSSFIVRILEKLKEKKYVIYHRKDLLNKKKYIFKINSNISKIQIISPHYFIKKKNIFEYEKKYLPYFGKGNIFISTSKGILTNEEILKKKIGGKLIFYIY